MKDTYPERDLSDATRLSQIVAEQERNLETLRALLAAQEQVVANMRDQLQNQLAQDAALSKAPTELNRAGTAHVLLSDCAFDVLLLLDTEQHIVAVNDAAEQLFGRPPQPGEGLLAYTESYELESMVLDAISYQEEDFEEQITISRRPYRTRVRTMGTGSDRLIGLAMEDVTDLVRLSRARRDMVANISHELRTPIANIRLIIDGLFHEGEKPKGKASRSALKDIARETDSLLWLVQELYDLSMIESGEAILRMIDVPLLPLVQEAIERMEDQSMHKQLNLYIDVPDTLVVLADRDQVRRVLMNLTHNAIKHSPEGGTISINAAAQNDDVVIGVIDEGPGVSEEHVQRVFERFYQIDPARSRGEGSGLGLAICKHIVEAHDGRIWAESNKQAPGGRFFFTLPLSEQTQ